ncbi:uncharacterized protein Dwil_GK17501 [Drosophila willistoni]|uniref:Importin subunit alpha n=1 Tax=Drosophila willistoni TaxID=7260 RepID=B4ML91_DROWI|nr:importin subunit alpha-7-like [Drosophila willistoni]EDW73349.1 uncharacterized protein Dwil_GK17501 [Drosophila willistoni]
MSSDSHKKLYKKLRANPTDMRTARISNFLELRKRKRENDFQRGRNMLLIMPTNGNTNENNELATNNSQVAEPTTSQVQQQPQLFVVSEELLQKLNSNEEQDLLQAISELHLSLSDIPNNTPIGELVHKNVVKRFVAILKNKNNDSTLQYEIVSILNKIGCDSSQVYTLIEAGAVPVLLDLLSSSDHKVQEDAMSALGNMAAESSVNRDLLFNSGIMVPLLHLLSSCPEVSLVRSAIWTFANLARWRNPPFDCAQIGESMFILKELLEGNSDPDILTDACLTVCYLSNAREHVQAVVDADICRHLVELLVHPERRVFTAALRAVGNVVHGNEQQIKVVLDYNALPCISDLMHYSSHLIRKEACRSIANIAAGNPDQIQAIIDANIFPQMLLMIKTAESKTIKEIIRSLTNATTFGTSDQIHYLAKNNSLPLICDFLTTADTALTLMTLKTLENILKVGNEYQTLPNPYALAIEECGGLTKIESLQSHEDLEIYHKSFNLIDQFFEDEEDDARMTPVTGIDQFEFSPQNLPDGSLDF